MSERVLAGGDVNVVVRVGDTVRRPQGPWSPAVHALFEHFESVGFDGAPRFLGIDDEGREILGYVEGREMWDRDSGEIALAGVRWLEEHRDELERWL